MAIKVPQNQIVFKYTSGGEYIVESTYKNYVGYFYEFRGKTYVGKEYNQNALTLIKTNSDKINKLLLNPKTAPYGLMSGMKLYPTTIPAYQYVFNKEDWERRYAIRYFAKKQNTSPDIIIREISEDTFEEYKDNPNYQLISITFDLYQDNFDPGVPRDIDKIEEQMFGIKIFLNL